MTRPLLALGHSYKRGAVNRRNRTPRGAHLLLQIRTRVLNGDWEVTFRE
jgi:hypothetical protein